MLNAKLKTNTDLYILGKLKEEDKKAIAVVGTRMPSTRGKKLTEEFVQELVKNGFTIISGMARGIDTIAHKTAIDSGGRTIAVLGSGIDVIYPYENKELYYSIIKNGAVVSGFPNGTKPIGKNFLARNQLIVKLSKAVLVIEGLKRSGTISTANHAANEGVDVYAVPGSEATDWLIGEGAVSVISPIDLINLM